MKYFTRFIKRLCYRVSKRLIRLLIFFHLLSLLLVSSVSAQNIYEYKDMQSLADGGTITTYIGNTPQQIDEVKYTISNFQSWNDITITDDNTFKNASIFVTNADNINADFNNGDVVYIRQKVVLNVDSYTYVTPPSTTRQSFYITVGVTDSSGNEKYVHANICTGVDTFHENTYDLVTLYLDGFVRLPNYNGSITSIAYNFDNISTGTLRVRIYPQSSRDSITYFVGSENNAPQYSGVDTDNVDDYHNQEDEILDKIQEENPLEKILTFFSGFKGFFDPIKFPKFNFPSVFSVWAYWFDVLLGYAWIKVFVFGAITIGMFSFVFSIARDGLNSAHHVGKDKSGKTSIANQRNSNLGG